MLTMGVVRCDRERQGIRWWPSGGMVTIGLDGRQTAPDRGAGVSLCALAHSDLQRLNNKVPGGP
jgi:hypothetical protein